LSAFKEILLSLQSIWPPFLNDRDKDELMHAQWLMTKAFPRV